MRSVSPQVKQSPVKLKPNTPAAAILSKEPQYVCYFKTHSVYLCTCQCGIHACDCKYTLIHSHIVLLMMYLVKVHVCTYRINACFSVRKDANPPSRLQKLSRFPENPEANWGPKTRAKRKCVVNTCYHPYTCTCSY